MLESDFCADAQARPSTFSRVGFGVAVVEFGDNPVEPVDGCWAAFSGIVLPIASAICGPSITGPAFAALLFVLIASTAFRVDSDLVDSAIDRSVLSELD
jgi:hypothetical protein